MADQTVTLPITPGKIQTAIETIVEQTFPRPREELCIPVGEMERRLAVFVGELVQAAYMYAIAPDARERLARHLYLDTIPADWRGHHELLWDRRSDRIDYDAVYARADELLAVITGKDT